MTFPGTLLTLGHGYTAASLSRRLLPQGWRVLGTVRDLSRGGSLMSQGVEPVQWEPAALLQALARASHVLVSAGPGPDGDPSLVHLSEALCDRAKDLNWVGYLSTTAVYGDTAGAWVDETDPASPGTARGHARVRAEHAWASIPDLPVHIFRLAGIYGPGRGPFAKVRAGTARRIVKPGQVFSRIHVEDIATTLMASLQRPNPGAIYNVCDDLPAPPEDVIAYAAKLLKLPIPPEVDFDHAEMTAMARSFYAESKRVRNDRIKTELGVSLKYPDYRTGLTALAETL